MARASRRRIHARYPLDGTREVLCGNPTTDRLDTTDPDRVTCPACLRALTRRAQLVGAMRAYRWPRLPGIG